MMLLLLVLCTLTIRSIVTIMTVVVMGRKLLYKIGKDIFEVCAAITATTTGATVVRVHAHIL